MLEVSATSKSPFAGDVELTTGGASPPETCKPSPSKVFIAKPAHSTAAPHAPDPFVPPAETPLLRRSVLSAVLVRPLPHSAPGLKPIWPITSTSSAVDLGRATDSLPVNHPAPFV